MTEVKVEWSDEYKGVLGSIRIEVPYYLKVYKEEGYKEVWLSAPTTFQKAALAWCRAVECVAFPFYPREMSRLVQEFGYWRSLKDPSDAELLDLSAEAERRSKWAPMGVPHCVTPRAPNAWNDGQAYGLLWETSVCTILVGTPAGWHVAIVGGHALRQEAAEKALYVPFTE